MLAGIAVFIFACIGIKSAMPPDNTRTHMLVEVITEGHKNGRILGQLASEGFQPAQLEKTGLTNDPDLHLMTITDL